MLRANEYGRFVKITNESDFALGWSLGQIVRGFGYFFLIRHGRNFDESEKEEVISRINIRFKEIQDSNNV